MPDCDLEWGDPRLLEDRERGRSQDQLGLRRASVHGVVVERSSRKILSLKVRSDGFIPSCSTSGTFNHLLGRSVLTRLIVYETSHEHLTGTTEEALLPQSNRETSQPQANDNSTTCSSPHRDVGSSQAGVRALVEEQVWTTACPLSPSHPMLLIPS